MSVGHGWNGRRELIPLSLSSQSRSTNPILSLSTVYLHCNGNEYYLLFLFETTSYHLFPSLSSFLYNRHSFCPIHSFFITSLHLLSFHPFRPWFWTILGLFHTWNTSIITRSMEWREGRISLPPLAICRFPPSVHAIQLPCLTVSLYISAPPLSSLSLSLTVQIESNLIRSLLIEPQIPMRFQR